MSALVIAGNRTTLLQEKILKDERVAVNHEHDAVAGEVLATIVRAGRKGCALGRGAIVVDGKKTFFGDRVTR